MHHKVFKYSHKDPRLMGEVHSLQGITNMIPARFRPYIMAISVIKRCLHPQSPDVAKVDRMPHIERVYSWVVEHDNSLRQTTEQAGRHHFDAAMQGSDLQWVILPYTAYEIDTLPVKRVVSTNYWHNAFASVGMRGVERRVSLSELFV
jgi:hypothetical protein